VNRPYFFGNEKEELCRFLLPDIFGFVKKGKYVLFSFAYFSFSKEK